MRRKYATEEERLAARRAASHEQYLRHREKRLEARRKYKETHQEKCKESDRQYHAKHAEERRAKGRAYYAAHKEELQAKALAYYAMHTEEIRVVRKQQRATNKPKRTAAHRQWRAKNPEKSRANTRKYHATHPLQVKKNNARRKAHRLALPATFTTEQQVFMLQYWGYACAVCGNQEGFQWTLVADHWIALASPLSPGTVVGNMIPLCHGSGGCNNSKSDWDPHEWLIKRVGLHKTKRIEQAIAAYFAEVAKRFGEELAS